MTEEEILAMEPGSDLNLLVCESIFDNKTLGSVKPYSTDIPAAWQVWLAVTEDHPEDWAIYSDTDGEVTVEHYPDNYKGDREASCGDFSVDGLFPEAICKAALLAKLEN